MSQAPGFRPHYGTTGDTATAPPGTGLTRSNTGLDDGDGPSMLRRRGRAATFRTVEDFEDFEQRPGWRPGAEPGVDPSKPDGGHACMPDLAAPCDITVVDFSRDNLAVQKFDNETIRSFLERPQPSWVRCRWINVNGLSWDVIQALGQHKHLHKLAIEDIMNTRNRTKAEWFPTHAFFILTLQKLVHLEKAEDEDTEGDDYDKMSRRSYGSVKKRLRRAFSMGPGSPGPSFAPGRRSQESGRQAAARSPNDFVTLQQFHSGPNTARTRFMERHSALVAKKLAVVCEQVSIFLTSDNTIISFFENSARDVEAPIVRRLQTADTVLRSSCDASMVGQAIIDAIIDLAIPVATCYGDVIGDLELDVLTRPSLRHTRDLYILISEINKVLGLITPIASLMAALKDHKTDVAADAAQQLRELQDPLKGVIISPLTSTYLNDVLDHCLMITETLTQLRAAAEGMISLIFNTISAYQNESMRQLTNVTIIFLPLTFITGYFGQNFDPFPDLARGIAFFWILAIPVVGVVVAVLMRQVITDYFWSLVQRRYVFGLRRSRRREQKHGRQWLGSREG